MPAKKSASKMPPPRLPILAEEQLSSEQRALLSSIRSGPRGGGTTIRGPFAMFLEARYHSVSRSASKGGVYQFVPITLGLLF